MSDKYYLAEDRIGYLSEKDYNRAKWAYDYQVKLCAWLRIAGYVNFEEQVDVHSSRDGHIGIPATKLAYLEIQRLVEDLNGFTDLETAAAHSPETAELVDMLGREVQTAAYRWPMEERPHRINVLRCGGCERLTLVYRPPRFEGDGIQVDCECGYFLDEEHFAWAVRLIEEEQNERKTVANNRRGTNKSA